MMTRSFRRTTILLLLVAAFATPLVCAAGPRAGDSPRPMQALAPARVDLFNQIWSSLLSLWSKTGCNIDPNGLCIASPVSPPLPTTQTDTGCNIDPSGRCSASAAPQPPPTIQTDEGCNIDPNGRCRS